MYQGKNWNTVLSFKYFRHMYSLKNISKVNVYLTSIKKNFNITDTGFVFEQLCFIYPMFSWNLYSKSVYFSVENSD